MPTTLKTLDAATGRVGGYLIAWGSPAQRDLQGEYFTPDTEFCLDWFERRPVLYHHGLDDALKTAIIGVIDTLRPDAYGVWAEAQLDLRERYVRAVHRLIERGILGWSSGSLAHLAQVEPDGRITRFPIIEGSLTPTPAEPRRTEVSVIKSAYAALGLQTDRFEPVAPPRASASIHSTAQGVLMHDEHSPTERAPRKRLPIASAADAVKTQVQVSSPYDALDALDLLHGYVMLRAAKSFHGVSERYANALAHKIGRAGWSAVKADELSRSTLTGFGDEWVPDLWSAQIWQRARLENAILPLFPALEMPSNPFELPTDGTDPNVFFVPETADETHLTLGSGSPIPDSKIGSGKITLHAKKLALRVGFSAELVEDSIVPVLSLYRQQAMRAIMDSIDHVLLNGDTASSGNVNTAATPGATDRYMAFDGLRKLPLATNTANAVDAANTAPTLALLRQTRFAMAHRYSARPADLAWIVDGGTYAKFLAMSEFLTMDKAGSLATAITGQIGFVDGAPVIVSAEMPLASANGKIAATGNTRGTALCVYRPGWYVGYRRRIAVSVDYLPYYDSYQLTATVRLAFAPFDNDVASALYNLAV